MTKTARTMPAGEFKAKCLAVLDEVAETGKSLVVTKRGRPVARVVPFREAPSLRGSVVREGDIVYSLDEGWDASR